LRWKVLSPLEAAIILFLDGQYSYGELRSMWFYLFGSEKSERKKASDGFDVVMQHFFSEGIVAVTGEASPSLHVQAELDLPPLKLTNAPTRLYKPISVMIASTNRCCANCIYCYAERKACPELSLGDLCQIFDDLRSHEIYIVDLVGTDIFVRRDAIRILEEMVARDFVFFLSTKSRIGPETALRLADLGIGIPGLSPHLVRPVQVSIDSADNGVASFLTKCRNYLYTAEETVKNLLHVGIKPKVKCVLTQFNGSAPEQLIEHFAAIGVDAFQFVQYGRSHYRHNDQLFLRKDQKLTLSQEMRRIAEQNPTLRIEYQDDTTAGDAGSITTPDTWRKRGLCSAGRVNMEVMPNGDCILCDQIPHSGEFIVGNILKQGVMGLWHDPKVTSFIFPTRDHFVGTVCFNCKEFDACHHGLGYCFRDSLFNYGTVFDAPPNCPRQIRPPLRQI